MINLGKYGQIFTMQKCGTAIIMSILNADGLWHDICGATWKLITWIISLGSLHLWAQTLALSPRESSQTSDKIRSQWCNLVTYLSPVQHAASPRSMVVNINKHTVKCSIWKYGALHGEMSWFGTSWNYCLISNLLPLYLAKFEYSNVHKCNSKVIW